jgi:hypothetical protein
MKKIHYIGYYRDENNEENYLGNIPGMLKMRYIKNILKRIGYGVCIYSLCAGKSIYNKEKTVVVDSGEAVIYRSSIFHKNKFFTLIDRYVLNIQFHCYMFFQIKKNDTIIVYHSGFVTKAIEFWEKLKNLNVIIEIEEIYGYSATKDMPSVYKEIKSLKLYRKFIVVNDIIPETLNLNKGDYVISCGVCEIPERKCQHFDDGLIHIVYAGTIERRKLGALTAIEASCFLPDNYFMHILGFGNNEAIKLALQKINQINKSAGRKRVEYHGMLRGEELTNFYHKCHIGISSYVMRPNFAYHTFPSKITTYMCHGLAVVLGYTKAFENHELSRNWSFFYEYKPEKVAEAILRINISKSYSHDLDIIKKMDLELCEWLKKEL